MKTTEAEERAGHGPDVDNDGKEPGEQGTARVYEAKDEPGTIVTEWPNGVVDRCSRETGTTTRTWPDGVQEKGPADAGWGTPYWLGTSGERPTPTLTVEVRKKK